MKDVEKAERKGAKSKAHKEATLAYEAEQKKPRSERQSAAQLCERFNEEHKLTPKSKLSPQVIKKATREGKAGESPLARGPKIKIPR